MDLGIEFSEAPVDPADGQESDENCEHKQLFRQQGRDMDTSRSFSFQFTRNVFVESHHVILALRLNSRNGRHDVLLSK